MDEETKNKTDDFFALLAEDEKAGSPTELDNVDIPVKVAEDEITFKDDSGRLKILKNGQVQDFVDFPVKKKEKIDFRPLPGIESKPILDQPVETVNLEAEVSDVIKKADVKFTDPELEKRFKNIIFSRLKGVRDQVQTRQALLNLAELGGVGLDGQKGEEVLQIIKDHVEHLDGKLRDSLSREPFADLKSEVSQILSEPEKPAPAKQPPTLEFKETENLPKPAARKPTPVPTSAPIKIIRPQPSPPPPKTETPVEPAKPKIEDVRFSPRLVGPIGELSSITLVDFRRLGKSAQEAAENILEKIKLLEKDSFADFIEGVRAWKKSEANQLYLEIGEQSMIEKKSVSQIIEQRKANNQKTLTEEEFEAVSDLNQKLRP